MSKIVTVPEPVLRQVAKPVQSFDKRIQTIISDMERTLVAAKDPEGVGLAAPQIGISLRIFLSRPTKRSKIKIFINPEILGFSEDQQSPDQNDGVYEGCLSIPNHYSPLERSLSVKVTYQTPKTTTKGTTLITKTEEFVGFEAHIIQHELDHLNGVLFIDRVLEQGVPLFKIKGKKWEEVQL